MKTLHRLTITLVCALLITLLAAPVFADSTSRWSTASKDTSVVTRGTAPCTLSNGVNTVRFSNGAVYTGRFDNCRCCSKHRRGGIGSSTRWRKPQGWLSVDVHPCGLV